jgi:Fe2+ transport system protein FeoA
LDELKKRRQVSAEGGTKVALMELKPGQKAKIVKIKGRGSTNKRIVDMGVKPGTMIEVERVAPPGDPVDVKVKGYHLSLRREEATGITVELQ